MSKDGWRRHSKPCNTLQDQPIKPTFFYQVRRGAKCHTFCFCINFAQRVPHISTQKCYGDEFASTLTCFFAP